jgi:hypothetical protein
MFKPPNFRGQPLPQSLWHITESHANNYVYNLELVSINSEIRNLEIKLNEAKVLKKKHFSSANSSTHNTRLLDEYSSLQTNFQFYEGKGKKISSFLGKRNWKDLIGSLHISATPDKAMYATDPKLSTKKFKHDRSFYNDYPEDDPKFYLEAKMARGVSDNQTEKKPRAYMKKSERKMLAKEGGCYGSKSAKKSKLEGKKKFSYHPMGGIYNFDLNPYSEKSYYIGKTDKRNRDEKGSRKDENYSTFGRKKKERMTPRKYDPRTRAVIRMAEKFGVKNSAEGKRFDFLLTKEFYDLVQSWKSIGEGWEREFLAELRKFPLVTVQALAQEFLESKKVQNECLTIFNLEKNGDKPAACKTPRAQDIIEEMPQQCNSPTGEQD